MASYCGGCLQNKVTSPALPTPRDLFCGSAHGHAGGLSGLLCKSGAHKRRQSAITSLVNETASSIELVSTINPLNPEEKRVARAGPTAAFLLPWTMRTAPSPKNESYLILPGLHPVSNSRRIACLCLNYGTCSCRVCVALCCSFNSINRLANRSHSNAGIIVPRAR